MKTETIDLKTPDGNCDAFVAQPDDGAAHPAVLFYMDAFGPRPWLHAMAKKLAARGYFVLLPNVFYRVRRAPVLDVKFPLRAEDMSNVRPLIGPLFQSFNPEMGMRDAGAYLDFLSAQKAVKPGKAGLTGYCMGGGLAIRTAETYPDRIAAAASFHAGGLASDKPDSPHLQLGKVKAELYIAHADNDQSMPPEQIERLRLALDQAGVTYEAEKYAGALHGFTMEDLPAYHAPSLERHWQKLFALFARALGK